MKWVFDIGVYSSIVELRTWIYFYKKYFWKYKWIIPLASTTFKEHTGELTKITVTTKSHIMPSCSNNQAPHCVQWHLLSSRLPSWIQQVIIFDTILKTGSVMMIKHINQLERTHWAIWLCQRCHRLHFWCKTKLVLTDIFIQFHITNIYSFINGTTFCCFKVTSFSSPLNWHC